MPVTWPITILPAPSEAVEITNNSNGIRTQMESGYVRQRKRFDALMRMYSVKWLLNNDQVAMFQSFVKYKLANGSLDFTIDLISGDFGLQNVTCRIVGGNYGLSHTDGFFMITAQLEVQDAQVVPEDIFDFVVESGLTVTQVFEMRDMLHELVHETLPEDLLPV